MEIDIFSSDTFFKWCPYQFSQIKIRVIWQLVKDRVAILSKQSINFECFELWLMQFN